MKKGWALILLISVGLNLGLGYRLLVGGPAGREPRGAFPAGQRLRPPRDAGIPPDAPRFGPEDPERWRDFLQVRLAMLAERLDLSPQQQQAFEQSQSAAAERVGPQLQLVREARRALHRLTLTADAPPESLRLAIRRVALRQAVMDSLVTETLLAELQVLSPEQRRIYMTLMPLGRDQHRGLPAWDRRGRGRRERSE